MNTFTQRFLIFIIPVLPDRSPSLPPTTFAYRRYFYFSLRSKYHTLNINLKSFTMSSPGDLESSLGADGKILIAIDLGTTFSGVAWAHTARVFNLALLALLTSLTWYSLERRVSMASGPMSTTLWMALQAPRFRRRSATMKLSPNGVSRFQNLKVATSASNLKWNRMLPNLALIWPWRILTPKL